MADERNFQNPPAEDPQPLVGFRTNDEWNALLAYVNGLVEEAESFADPEVKEKVFELLQGIDAIHREALTRLIRLFKKGVLEQVVTDPAIRSLMELYDLMPQKPGCGETPDFVTGYPPHGSEPKAGETISEKALSDRVPIPHWVPALDKKDDLAPGELGSWSIFFSMTGEGCCAVSAKSSLLWRRNAPKAAGRWRRAA